MPSDTKDVVHLKKMNCVPAPIIIRVHAPTAAETAEKAMMRTEDITNMLISRFLDAEFGAPFEGES